MSDSMTRPTKDQLRKAVDELNFASFKSGSTGRGHERAAKAEKHLLALIDALYDLPAEPDAGMVTARRRAGT